MTHSCIFQKEDTHTHPCTHTHTRRALDRVSDSKSVHTWEVSLYKSPWLIEMPVNQNIPLLNPSKREKIVQAFNTSEKAGCKFYIWSWILLHPLHPFPLTLHALRHGGKQKNALKRWVEQTWGMTPTLKCQEVACLWCSYRVTCEEMRSNRWQRFPEPAKKHGGAWVGGRQMPYIWNLSNLTLWSRISFWNDTSLLAGSLAVLFNMLSERASSARADSCKAHWRKKWTGGLERSSCQCFANLCWLPAIVQVWTGLLCLKRRLKSAKGPIARRLSCSSRLTWYCVIRRGTKAKIVSIFSSSSMIQRYCCEPSTARQSEPRLLWGLKWKSWSRRC